MLYLNIDFIQMVIQIGYSNGSALTNAALNITSLSLINKKLYVLVHLYSTVFSIQVCMRISSQKYLLGI